MEILPKNHLATSPKLFFMQQNIETVRHSLAHILAAAIKTLYPQAQLAIGPAIEHGFYYDIDFGDTKVTDSDLPQIEKKMRGIIAQKISFTKSEVSVDAAIKSARDAGEIYKVALLEDLKNTGETNVSFYTCGDFSDLCRGPHIQSSEEITPNSFKLNKIAGAYWRGDEKNKMLTRIYGLAFESKEKLDEYLKNLEEAEKRDHRKLGSELELFMISEDVGRGLPLWLPNGAFIRRQLENYIYEKEREHGYKYVYTPILTHKKLYETSGHLAHYSEDMYSPIDIEGEEYYLKPMNCPHHHQIYKNKLMSYKELPLRLAEFGLCHRFERSGVLTGLIRARCFTQNDSHIYCRPEQVKDELTAFLHLFKEVYADFGITDYWFRLSLPDFENNPEKYGNIENKDSWNNAAQVIREVLTTLDLSFTESAGDATFYGPKIDIQIKNVFDKEDTIATAQVDFYSADKFNLNFINEKGEKEHVVIIHRAIMGSFDRFFAFLVEQYAGAFPLWLSPTQIKILPVSETHIEYCQKLTQTFQQNGLRATADNTNETIGNKIRKSAQEKIPYSLVIGDKEITSGKLAVRARGQRETREIGLDEFIAEANDLVVKKQ